MATVPMGRASWSDEAAGRAVVCDGLVAAARAAADLGLAAAWAREGRRPLAEQHGAAGGAAALLGAHVASEGGGSIKCCGRAHGPEFHLHRKIIIAFRFQSVTASRPPGLRF